MYRVTEETFPEVDNEPQDTPEKYTGAWKKA
jgi:hypothetical protein